MSLFASSNESLIKSLNRRAKLVRSLTSGENLDHRSPPESQSELPTIPRKPRTITWSGSSPMRGFDLQHNAANKPQQLHTRAHLILKLKPVVDDTLLKKVTRHHFTFSSDVSYCPCLVSDQLVREIYLCTS
jgi:hypothetical protein